MVREALRARKKTDAENVPPSASVGTSKHQIKRNKNIKSAKPILGDRTNLSNLNIADSKSKCTTNQTAKTIDASENKELNGKSKVNSHQVALKTRSKSNQENKIVNVLSKNNSDQSFENIRTASDYDNKRLKVTFKKVSHHAAESSTTNTSNENKRLNVKSNNIKSKVISVIDDNVTAELSTCTDPELIKSAIKSDCDPKSKSFNSNKLVDKTSNIKKCLQRTIKSCESLNKKNNNTKSNSRRNAVNNKADKCEFSKMTSKKILIEEDFFGFEKEPLKSHYLEAIKKQLGMNSLLPNRCKNNHQPVYKTIKPSPIKHILQNEEDRLNLYEFEVDENEPVPKKNKRKPILKMGSKKFRTYKKKKKIIGNLSPLNLSNQENICPSAQNVSKLKSSGEVNSKPKSQLTSEHKVGGSDKQLSKCSNKSFAPSMDSLCDIVETDEVDNSIDEAIAARQNILYSPKPYRSPKRASLNVPIVRSSIAGNNENEQPKHLNASIISSNCNTSINSPFCTNFNSPMYIGSSTPIQNHWAEQSNNVYTNINNSSVKNLNVSQYFGFNESSMIEEPCISPIKKYVTPAKSPKPVFRRRHSPIRMPHSEVVRLLTFGCDADNKSQDVGCKVDLNSLQMDELLPINFFHDGDTPPHEFHSLESYPRSPVTLMKFFKNNKKEKKTTKTKKKVVIVENRMDLENSVAEEAQEEFPPPKIIPPKGIYQNTRYQDSNKSHFAETTADEVIIRDNNENREVEEVDFSSFEHTSKKPRRSYERPEYARAKKQDLFSDHEDEEEPEPMLEVTKTAPKKRNVLSKKEAKEMESWAKAFNEQCMMVDNFDLVVE